MRLVKEGVCAVKVAPNCKGAAICSITSIISTIGVTPRTQRTMKSVKVCASCLALLEASQVEGIRRAVPVTKETFTGQGAASPSPVEIVRDWFTLAPQYRTKEKLVEMVQAASVRPPRKRKKFVENPDHLRVRLTRFDRDAVRLGLRLLLRKRMDLFPVETKEAAEKLLARIARPS